MLSAKDLRETDRYIVQGSVVGKVINHTLSQRNQEGNERVVEQDGRILKKGETRYTTIEGELLAIMEAVRKYHHYWISKEFTIRSNYIILEYLQGWKERESGRLHHWGTQLSQYAFTLEQTLYVQKATIEISSSRMDKDTRHQGVIEGLDEKIRRDNIEYARQISETSRTSQGTVDIGQEADPLVKDLGRDLIDEHLDPEWRILGGTRRRATSEDKGSCQNDTGNAKRGRRLTKLWKRR